MTFDYVPKTYDCAYDKFYSYLDYWMLDRFFCFVDEFDIVGVRWSQPTTISKEYFLRLLVEGSSARAHGNGKNSFGKSDDVSTEMMQFHSLLDHGAMWKTKNGSVICSAITYESNDNIISSFLNMRQNLFSTTQYPFLQENLILEFLDEKKFRFNRKADDEDHFILIYYDEEHKESDSIRSYDDLLRKAIAYSAPGSFRSHYTSSFTRNRYVSDFAKLRANGFCQLCGQEAPFLDRNEIPYLETHHIISLADGGEDSIDNTVALCPNCHRKMHSADPDLLTEDIKKLLSIASLY